MKAALIIVGLATGGLALLWYRNKKAAEEKPPEPGACDTIADAAAAAAELALKGSGGAARAAALLACKGLGAVNPFHDSAADFNKESDKRDKTNQQLNGAIDLPASRAGFPALRGGALRYKNGCVPFEGADGWTKCAPGTQSMWARDIDGAADNVGFGDAAFPAFPTNAARDAFGKNVWPTLINRGPTAGTVAIGPGNHAQLLSGSVDPKRPDPATHGAPGALGKWFGFVRGVPVECPAGQAPALWDAAGNPINDHRTGPVPCAPGGVSTFVPSQGAPPPKAPQPGTSTQLQCGPNGQPPAGMTWDPQGFWRRPMAGEAINAGPCAGPVVVIDATRVLAAGRGRLATR